jgi:uncharacterized protein
MKKSHVLQRVLLTVCMAVAAPFSNAQDTAQINLPRVALSHGLYLIDAQVASTPEQRQVGLMHRKSMPQHEGMIFVFEQATVQCFWMKNTLLPLSVAFIDGQGVIANIAEMQELTTHQHCSAKPVRFVLEMNQAWFSKRNIKAGDHIKGTIFSAASTR